jgi:hypothetical protein
MAFRERDAPGWSQRAMTSKKRQGLSEMLDDMPGDNGIGICGLAPGLK